MISDAEWSETRRIVRRSIRTSLHCSIASTNRDGTPHVTPIGSVLLGEKGSGLYFDVFNARLAANLDHDPHAAVLAVDSGYRMWLRSLVRGRFVSPPGIRLIGTVGPRRVSTQREIDRFQRIVRLFLHTPGGRIMWGSLPAVRDIRVDRVQRLELGPMTEPAEG